MVDILIAGGSIAGFSAASELRSSGFDGTIRIVGAEPHRTYQRPPLSKDVLAGGDDTKVAWNAAENDDLKIDWLLGDRVTGLDTGASAVSLASGEVIGYEGLVIATGASPRRLRDQPELAGVHVMRTLDDSLGLRAQLDAGVERVVVVGAGFIGAEVAATCRGRGHEVTMVEPLDWPLVRVLGEEMGRVVAGVHREHGVDLRLGVGVDAIEGDDRVERVRLSDGSSVEADAVVVGIGVVPNTGWLEGSGVAIDDGVVADESCRVADRIVACGDVARWKSPRYGSVRVEHWDNAVDMGRAAARTLLVDLGLDDGPAAAYDPVPWFWSDQYGVRIQMAGRPLGEMQITEGSIDDGKFVALYGQDGQVTGALGWNWPAKAVRYRMALEDGLAWEDAVG